MDRILVVAPFALLALRKLKHIWKEGVGPFLEAVGRNTMQSVFSAENDDAVVESATLGSIFG